MPNDVTNQLTITGPPEEVAGLVARAKEASAYGGVGHHFSLNPFVPMPPDVFRGGLGRDEEKAYPGEKNWYGWSIAHWGTKWDCYAVGVKESASGRVVLQFDTAWAAPRKFLESLAAQYPPLRFEHEWVDEDSGGQNHGRALYKGGKLVSVVHFNGRNPTPDLEDMALRLKGKNPYLPRCRYCEDSLNEADIQKFGLTDREGICSECQWADNLSDSDYGCEDVNTDKE